MILLMFHPYVIFAAFLSSRTSVRQIYYFSPPEEVGVFPTEFKSNIRETWRVILVSGADIFLSESLRIPAERLSQSEIGLRLR
mgnify:CR=1 FL=1